MRKTVVITGAGRGIGACIVRKFANENMQVVVNYNKSEKEALSLVSFLKSKGAMAVAVKANIANPSESAYLMEKSLEEFGKIDILINNAAISCMKVFTDITLPQWTSIFNVNVNGMFCCTQLAVKDMLKRHSGKIINISSIWGITGASCEVAYSASKAAVIGFTKSLAKELGPSNILVNCVAPGLIDTDMNSNLKEDDIENFVKETPLLKMGTPEDVANVVEFLSGDKSNFITGQIISPNGGVLI